MKKMNPVIHFEMAAGDSKRMADFYSKVFGWDTNVLGEEMGNYVTVSTTETGADGRPTMPGTINGGFYPKKSTTYHEPSIVIGVDDIHESIKEVIAAGGKMLNEPHEIPGIGTYASFMDTEGNRASMLQPKMS